MRKLPLLLSCLALAASAGCYSRGAKRSERAGASQAVGEVTRSAAPEPSKPGAPPSAPQPGPSVVIKKGSLTLIVTEAKAAEDRIADLLRTHGGYVAGRRSDAYVPQQKYLAPSEVHTLHLTLKVPAKTFDAFVAALKEVGSYTSEEISLEDVTFAYQDLNARLSNQRKIEERLLGHLAQPDRDFKVVLEIEKELGRVREQIEQLSAQLRVLEDQIAYSTLNLTLSVRPEWTAPEDRTFWQDLGDAVSKSVSFLGETVQGIAILLAALLPWLVIAGVFALAVILIVRRAGRRKRPSE